MARPAIEPPTASARVAPAAPPHTRTSRQVFWSRFRHDKSGLVPTLFLVIVFFMGISADFFSKLIIHHDAEQQFVHTMLDDFAIPKGPNTQFWFGADDAGRDLFIRVLYGVRVSLFIAVVATGMQVVIGVTLGVLAGFLRGWVDRSFQD